MTVSEGQRTPLPEGLYVPTVAFFTDGDEVDVNTTVKHAEGLIKAGVAGIVTHGSNGEAVHLDHNERQVITKATKTAYDNLGLRNAPLIVGCGAQSTRETIQLCREAQASGGTHAMILPPSYYGGLVTMDLIMEHFRIVADASPIPILIYNFPAPCGGLDLSSDVILKLAKHPNIVGAKLTCGNTGKLSRIVAGTEGTGFRVFGGSADFTIQTLSVGGHGVIAGTANLTPLAIGRLIDYYRDGDHRQARALQMHVAQGDWAAIKGGFVSVKAALQHYYGYGGLPRRPCVVLEGKALREQMAEFEDLIQVEKELRSTSQGTK